MREATFSMSIPGAECTVAGAGHKRIASKDNIIDPVAVALVSCLGRAWLVQSASS